MVALTGQPIDPATLPAPEEFEKKFVKAPDANDLTLALKKKIARPRPGVDEDQKLGYNPDAVDSFLRGKSFPNPLELVAACRRNRLLQR